MYLLYLDQNRVDGQTNELVASVHRDQRDFLNLAAYSARSLIGVVIHDPLVFFIHCEESTRPMIRTIMNCADQTIQLFGELDIIGMKDPPVIDILSQKVLAALPRLKKTYDSWWLAKKAELERDYSLATSKRSWPYISAHLHNAAPFMLATHKRNLDFDCKDIPELEFAPKPTDTTESSFSCVDSAIKSNGAEGGIYSCFGVAQAKIMQFLQTPG